MNSYKCTIYKDGKELTSITYKCEQEYDYPWQMETYVKDMFTKYMYPAMYGEDSKETDISVKFERVTT